MAMAVALVLAGLLLLIAVLSSRRQLANLRRLHTDPHVPSDERLYLRNQARRRLANGLLLFVMGGMLAGAYLSGLDHRANEIAYRGSHPQAEGEQPPPVSESDRDFARFYLGYWIVILILLFVVFTLAIVDLLATRRFGMAQLRRIRQDQRVLLDRDLAVYRQQRANERMRGGSPPPAQEPPQG